MRPSKELSQSKNSSFRYSKPRIRSNHCRDSLRWIAAFLVGWDASPRRPSRSAEGIRTGARRPIALSSVHSRSSPTRTSELYLVPSSSQDFRRRVRKKAPPPAYSADGDAALIDENGRLGEPSLPLTRTDYDQRVLRPVEPPSRKSRELGSAPPCFSISTSSRRTVSWMSR